jgi:hypothetical protein
LLSGLRHLAIPGTPLPSSGLAASGSTGGGPKAT